VHLHGRSLETQTFLLVREEFLNILALIALELDDLTHLGVAHDGAIASELLLDHLENLLLVELLGKTLDSGQGLATVTLYVRALVCYRECYAFEDITYAGYGCGCSSETAFQYRRLHPLRRTGLW
jgi:hypothetical protein